MEESKQLLLKDLSARLSYGVKGRVYAETTNGEYDIDGDMIFFDSPFDVTLDGINTSTEEIHVVAIGNEDTVDFIEMQQTDGAPYTIDDFKPYLRPMSSMTEQEKEDLLNLLFDEEAKYFYIDKEGLIDGKTSDLMKEGLNYPAFCPINVEIYTDFLNVHHFDWRHLIEKGLALEAPKDMYNIK